ncbi:hypothetical protein B0A49_03014 [Cryomyces minteri]|uniref:BAG domain-containing protein n=1 Tax=Cryomyces minteri TaxID=331657 RepID=A0A4U0XES0_9PEZI|nr:hypothetical protein B0A49_03014 [Cryomyces minteri]
MASDSPSPVAQLAAQARATQEAINDILTTIIAESRTINNSNVTEEERRGAAVAILAAIRGAMQRTDVEEEGVRRAYQRIERTALEVVARGALVEVERQERSMTRDDEDEDEKERQQPAPILAPNVDRDQSCQPVLPDKGPDPERAKK